jgi:hypothetical protein
MSSGYWASKWMRFSSFLLKRNTLWGIRLNRTEVPEISLRFSDRMMARMAAPVKAV